jgi:hypothetical protein
MIAGLTETRTGTRRNESVIGSPGNRKAAAKNFYSHEPEALKPARPRLSTFFASFCKKEAFLFVSA